MEIREDPSQMKLQNCIYLKVFLKSIIREDPSQMKLKNCIHLKVFFKIHNKERSEPNEVKELHIFESLFKSEIGSPSCKKAIGDQLGHIDANWVKTS